MHKDSKNKIISAIEQGEYFAKCLNTVSDDLGIYCVSGKEYEVVNLIENENEEDCYILECEEDEIQVNVNDKDFEFYIKNNLLN